MGSMYFPENTVPATAGSTGADTSVAASVAARNARAGRPRTDVKVSTSFFLGRSCAALVTQARRLDATRGFARCVSVGVAVTANIGLRANGKCGPRGACAVVEWRGYPQSPSENRPCNNNFRGKNQQKVPNFQTRRSDLWSQLHRRPDYAMVKPGVFELASVVEDASLSADDKLFSLSRLFLEQATCLQKCEKKLECASSERGIALIQRDAVRVDLEKQIAVKDRLEALCRELQKTNKACISDAKAAAVSEASKRAVLSDKFESGLGDISEKLSKHTEERAESLKENETLREHLRRLLERGDLQDAHFAKAKETFELEKQFFEAQLSEAGERKKAGDALRDALEKQLAARMARENALTEQLAGYADRYQEFQNVITESNAAFVEFKKESTHREKTLTEKELRCLELERKSAKTDVALIEIVQERDGFAKRLAVVTAQKEKLEGLCRVLRGNVRLDSKNVDPSGTVGKAETLL